VGNLTVGGTGKTPLVAYLARRILGAGKKPAILTRGYGGRNRGTVVLGPEAGAEIYTHDLVGDEALMLSALLAGVPVIVDRNRYRGGHHGQDRYPVDVFILDDGMQHRRLYRDLDLVVIDALNPFSNGRLLPAGGLRESPAGLRRADAVIISRSDKKDPDRRFEEKLTALCPGRPVFHSDYEIRGFYPFYGEKAPSDLQGAGVVAFAGIGRPSLFFADLRSAGCRVLASHAYTDHFRYGPSDIAFLKEQVVSLRADGLVTTEKDAQRLKGLSFGTIPVYYMSIRASIREEKAFTDFLCAGLEGRLGWQ
jgi:tetraacyldisaccharide 4'-kinase